MYGISIYLVPLKLQTYVKQLYFTHPLGVGQNAKTVGSLFFFFLGGASPLEIQFQGSRRRYGIIPIYSISK